MFKKLATEIKEFIKEEYKFTIFMILLFIILNFPLNYYIAQGGGISSAEERINVENKYESKGSFNISYVRQARANVLVYGLSYIMPNWERESIDLYKYDEQEDEEDVQNRSELSLKLANSNAVYWAYTLANKEIKETSKKIYIIGLYNTKNETDLKVADEIVSINDKHFETIPEYTEYIQTIEEDEIQIKVIRSGKEKTITTKLNKDNGNYIGIILSNLYEYETNPKVNIQFKRSESGPSGGLITTLEMYNQLTKKDLTKGKTIAGTGTIERDGTIGQIGGIEHKILGAASAKADVFISPAGDNYKDAKKYIKKKKLKIKLIKAKTIEDAIKKLEELK